MNNSQADIEEFVHQVEELHPIAFRLAFGLTHEAAAEELGLEPQTMRSYLRQNPSRRVRKLAATIAKQWLSDGRPLVNREYFIPYSSAPWDIKHYS